MQGDAAKSNNLTHDKGKEIITFTGNRMKEIEAATTAPLKNECLIKFFTGVLLVTHLGATTTYEEVQMQEGSKRNVLVLGNIGNGKSTFLNKIGTYIKNNKSFGADSKIEKIFKSA